MAAPGSRGDRASPWGRAHWSRGSRRPGLAPVLPAHGRTDVGTGPVLAPLCRVCQQLLEGSAPGAERRQHGVIRTTTAVYRLYDK
ncbi:hypothetical protein AV530_017961 [Patagioenas fasciata monilis]|uniref:Uncharacterized protein n=1 Tax=Patagioenas fasciata monilis TaxID=372326 RepID=A0A1V4KKH2_PATFA|nr:hypothetical protein AV530_017961 [Patagioenas fasciata monilis]